MRKSAADRSRSRAVSIATGIMRPRAPILFMKDEATRTPPVSAPRWPKKVPVSGRVRRAMIATTPVICKVRLMTRTAATVMTAWFEKPEKASAGGTMPAPTTTSSVSTATTSCRTRPDANRARAPIRVSPTTHCEVAKGAASKGKAFKRGPLLRARRNRRRPH